MAQAKEIFVPVLVYRTGAYAPNGAPWADGFVDIAAGTTVARGDAVSFIALSDLLS